MDVRILGVPMDLGANRRGTDMGPSAVRVARLSERLRQLGHDVEDLGNVYTPTAETKKVTHEGLRYLDEIVQVCDTLARRVEKVVERGGVPVVLGGDHSLAMGSVGGVARAGREVGLVWVDAHGDFNTAETSPSGNIHGMPLAHIAGLGHPELADVGGVNPKVPPERVALVGVRSLDESEQEVLREHDVAVYTMRDVDELGMRRVMDRALERATRDVDHLHVSFDVDVVDPEHAPGVGTPVPGGLTFREAHLAMEMVSEHGAFGSLDVVEVNPLIDERNRTAELAAHLATSALGKRIL